MAAIALDGAVRIQSINDSKDLIEFQVGSTPRSVRFLPETDDLLLTSTIGQFSLHSPNFTSNPFNQSNSQSNFQSNQSKDGMKLWDLRKFDRPLSVTGQFLLLTSQSNQSFVNFWFICSKETTGNQSMPTVQQTTAIEESFEWPLFTSSPFIFNQTATSRVL